MSELRTVADMMALAARTAPKSVGKDFVVIRIIEGNDVRVLAEKMLEFGQQTGKVNFDRDGKNIAASDVVVLIGIKDAQPLGLNCGACGVDICEMLPINTFVDPGFFVLCKACATIAQASAVVTLFARERHLWTHIFRSSLITSLPSEAVPATPCPPIITT